MLSQKRKRSGDVDDDHYSEVSASFEQAQSDDEIDISSALTGKKAKLARNTEESDDDFNEFLQESIAKRDIKGGTEVVKKAKGKGKIVKGELGGGSFQSMGEWFIVSPPLWYTNEGIQQACTLPCYDL